MKTFFKYIVLLALFSPSAFAVSENTSVIDALDNENTEILSREITLESFESCQAFETVMQDYYKKYWKENQNPYPIYNYFGGPEVMESIADDAVSSPSSKDGLSNQGGGYSETNTQVKGVDEADIIKTDGKYIYYYNQTESSVSIIEAGNQETTPKVLNTITLPKSFYNPELYISNERLIIVSSGYSQTDFTSFGYYINRNAKTYSIIFDTKNKSKPELIKLYSSDGDYKQSRLIGETLYVISSNSFQYPYYNLNSSEDIDFDVKKMLPQKLEITRTQDSAKQNLIISKKSLPFQAIGGSVTNCNNISYSFPDAETIKNNGFNPGYNIISTINIQDIETKVETKVIAGNNSEIHMSQDNLYMTESLYSAGDFSCPINAICARPFFWGGNQNTLIHKLSIDQQKIKYLDSTLIPGAPLSQYSMDEFNGNFRIITSSFFPERSTSLYVLNKDLKKISSLENLAPGEGFQSSRFIGDKLFLVTFEQIDPLFAIDISDTLNPKVLGELKIPGFSTYLHPYDENHLIGLGYDTETNLNGGTQSSGIKVDLYTINYDKKCGDAGLSVEQVKKCNNGDYKGIIVEQTHTKTLGGKGSYSEALTNPRMFIWNDMRKTLLLPVTLSERDDSYTLTDYFNGMYAIKIDLESGIEVLGKTTHIDMTGLEEARTKECLQYSAQSSEPICRELLNGEIVCESPSIRQYVPNYCYKDSSIWQYVGDKSWEFQDKNIKRALYIGENVYGVSDSQIGLYNWKLDEKQLQDFK